MKDFWNRIKPQLMKVETWVKTVLFMVVGGGLSSVLAVYSSGMIVTFDVEGLKHLRNSFLSGCLIALLGFWLHSPLFAPRTQQQ